MKTVAVISQKGGVGKTTLAVHLATAAEAAGFASLIIDTDPQATASSWAEWRAADAPACVSCAAHALLPKTVQRAEAAGAQFVVIDTPPHADIMAREAADLADIILVPCRPRAFDLAAVRTSVALAKASGKPAFVIFVAGPPRAHKLYAQAELLVKQAAVFIAPTILPERAVFCTSVGEGKTAFEVEPEGKAAEEVNALFAWVCKLVNLKTRKQVSKRKGVA